MNKIIYLDTAKDKTTNPKNEFDKIIKTFFNVSDNILLINMFNFLYNDNIPQDSKVSLLNFNDCNNLNNIFIRTNAGLPSLTFSIKNKSMNNIYVLEFKDNMFEKFTISISKFTLNNYSNKKCISINVPNIIIVSFEKDLKEPDQFPLEININDHEFNYEIPHFKSWKYSLDELCKNNLFILLPFRFLILKSYIFNPWKCDMVINEINKQMNDIFLNINFLLERSLNGHILSYKQFNILKTFTFTMRNFISKFVSSKF